jgi:hypothetical protein
MTYLEAEILKEKNLHIIGSKYKGEKIDELIIHPINSMAFLEFIKIYTDSLNAEESVEIFKDMDLIVSFIVNKKYLGESELIPITPLENLKGEKYNLNW